MSGKLLALARKNANKIITKGGFQVDIQFETANGDKIVDVKVEYPADFKEQMMFYGKNYSFLPVK